MSTIPIASSRLSRMYKLLEAFLFPFLLKVSIEILLEETIAVSMHEKKDDPNIKKAINI
jgi:hypothetical protein